MKFLLVLCLSVVFISCESTIVADSVCGSSRTDITGFEGDLKLSLLGQQQPIKISRVAMGEYEIVDPEGGTEDLKFVTCKVGTNLIAETSADASNEVILMDVVITRKAFIFTSILFDTDLLDQAGVSDQFIDSEREDIPLTFTSIENHRVDAKKLLSLIGNPEGKTAFGLTFLK